MLNFNYYQISFFIGKKAKGADSLENYANYYFFNYEAARGFFEEYAKIYEFQIEKNNYEGIVLERVELKIKEEEYKELWEEINAILKNAELLDSDLYSERLNNNVKGQKILKNVASTLVEYSEDYKPYVIHCYYTDGDQEVNEDCTPKYELRYIVNSHKIEERDIEQLINEIDDYNLQQTFEMEQKLTINSDDEQVIDYDKNDHKLHIGIIRIKRFMY